MRVAIEGNGGVDELEMEQLQPSISYSLACLCFEQRISETPGSGRGYNWWD